MHPQSISGVDVVRTGIKYGAIAGLIATWSISTAIAASELELGLPISAFYAIMGMSLGYGDFVQAAYLGFGLHLLTGAILGIIIGFVSSRLVTKIVLNPYKAVLMGMATGMAVWLVLFLPITALLVQPSIQRISFLLAESFPSQSAMLSGNTGQLVWGIGLSAIAFHLVWGAIFGYIFSSLVRIKAFRVTHTKGETMQ
jgi:hypothetical protein